MGAGRQSRFCGILSTVICSRLVASIVLLLAVAGPLWANATPPIQDKSGITAPTNTTTPTVALAGFDSSFPEWAKEDRLLEQRIDDLEGQVSNYYPALEKVFGAWGVFGFLGIVGLAAAVLRWYWVSIKGKVSEKVDSEINQLTGSHLDSIKLAVDDQRRRKLIRTNFKILVIETINSKDKKFDLLQKTGFKNLTTKTMEEALSEPLEDYQLVVIDVENNKQRGWSEETAGDGYTLVELVKFFDKTHDKDYHALLFIVGIYEEESGKEKVLGYANSPVTLFARTMECLEYMSLINNKV